MGIRNQFFVIGDRAIGGRILNDHAEDVVPVADTSSFIEQDDFDIQWTGAGLNQLDCLGMTGTRDEEAMAGSLADALAKRHRFGRRGGFVQQ